jgi:S1-C subfamily serine protease
MTISGLGTRLQLSSTVERGYLERNESSATTTRKTSPDRMSGLQTGLLAGGGLGLFGGLALRAAGMGRVGTGLAAIGGALLGVSLLAACVPVSSGLSKRSTDVPGDEGPPGDVVTLRADTLREFPAAGADSTNPAPDGYEPVSGSLDAREGVVQLRHSEGMGSGWVVEPGMVITNYHVAQGFGQVEVVDHVGASHAGTVLRLDKTHDLALVSVPTLDDTPLERDDVVEYAETAETTGYPGGEFNNDRAVAVGDIGINDGDIQRDAILLNGTSAQGVSGGAVINGAGEVIGTSFAVGTLGDTDPTEFVLAIPNSQVQGLLDAHRAAAAATPRGPR